MELFLSLSRFKVTVIYKDIESGNFLLDTEVNAKIFYCGTTRITDKNKWQANINEWGARTQEISNILANP